MPDKVHNFEYDMFLGGPPDRRAPFPYKQQIKDAFPDIRIYDWEDYKGDDYQEHNNQALKSSFMMVSLVPDFPMPGIGPELGYFYAHNEDRIKEGLQLGIDFDGTVERPSWKAVRTDPHHYAILIWPDSVKPDFAKKTIGHYGLIVPNVLSAIEEIQMTFQAQTERHDYAKRMELAKMQSIHSAPKPILRWRKEPFRYG